jgi:hypothetical protein
MNKALITRFWTASDRHKLSNVRLSVRLLLVRMLTRRAAGKKPSLRSPLTHGKGCPGSASPYRLARQIAYRSGGDAEGGVKSRHVEH